MDYNYLCMCNRCGTILIDHNPTMVNEMLPSDDDVQDMVLIEDENGEFWACPNCMTDAYLIDLDIDYDYDD